MTLDYTIEIFLAMFSLDGNDRLYKEKVSALLGLDALIKEYEHKMLCGEALLMSIARKKIAFIRQADTAGELDEILRPPKPRYNYCEVVPNSRFNVLEEELVLWAWVSCSNILVDHAIDRYRKVFNQVFPDNTIWKEK